MAKMWGKAPPKSQKPAAKPASQATKKAKAEAKNPPKVSIREKTRVRSFYEIISGMAISRKQHAILYATLGLIHKYCINLHCMTFALRAFLTIRLKSFRHESNDSTG